MRKSGKIFAGAVCGIVLFSTAACGAAGAAKDSMMQGMNASSAYLESSSAPQASGGWASSESWDGDVMYESPQDVVADDGFTVLYEESARKTIKTASLSLQTMEFDDFVAELQNYVASVGAYMQYANIYGNSMYYSSRRSADYTIRVPQQNLEAFLDGIGDMAVVVNKTIGEEDVTLQYVDIESRLETLRVEQERLLALLERAEDLDSIIRLEQRLSEVRYSIESYTASLRTYDNQITYSTVRISVSEVNRVSEPTPVTLGDRIRTGWSDTLYEIAMGAQDFFVWFVVNLPYLVFWAAVIAVCVVLLKKKIKKRTLRKTKKNDETELGGKE